MKKRVKWFVCSVVLFSFLVFQEQVFAENMPLPIIELNSPITARTDSITFTIKNYDEFSYQDDLVLTTGDTSYQESISEEVTFDNVKAMPVGTVFTLSHLYDERVLTTLQTFTVIKGKAPEFTMPKIIEIDNSDLTVDFDTGISKKDTIYGLLNGKKIKSKNNSYYAYFSFDNLKINDVVAIYYETKNGTLFDLGKVKVVDTIPPSTDDFYQDEISIRDQYVMGEGLESGLKVTVLANNKKYTSTVKSNQTFKVKIPTLKSKTVVQTYFTDKNGNNSGVYSAKVYNPYSEPGVENFTFKDVNTRSTRISGKVYNYRKGDIMQIKLGKKTYKVKVRSDKTFSLTIKKQKVNSRVYLTNKDVVGNVLEDTWTRVYTTTWVDIGMTKKQVKNTAWGSPDEINKTVTKYGTYEQWVYGYSYLYFENGKLVTIQN